MKLFRTGFTFLALNAMATLVLAQEPVKLPGNDSGVMQWVITAGVLVAVLGAALMNPKRSHLS